MFRMGDGRIAKVLNYATAYSLLHLLISWLFHNGPMWIRTLYQPFITPALAYLNEVISRVKDLQFYTENGNRGGPIIMVQVGSAKSWQNL